MLRLKTGGELFDHCADCGDRDSPPEERNNMIIEEINIVEEIDDTVALLACNHDNANPTLHWM